MYSINLCFEQVWNLFSCHYTGKGLIQCLVVLSAMLDPVLAPTWSCRHQNLQRGFSSMGVPQYGGKWKRQNFWYKFFWPSKNVKEFLSQQGPCNKSWSLEKTLFPFPTSITFHVITHFSSLEAQTQTCKSTFNFLWPCFTALSPFAVLLPRSRLYNVSPLFFIR